ncbi:hypothetical protein DAPK24_011570 [Pichia kluyveri]|uniref:Cleavage/polyadenylation specificity factor A subunit N-terminal domain-containing protein n=1 Tax=Pichia kluyveri TaxID=36015 RepID=A0AAV5QZZ9_PICKL|nr:hypothetical protein DAPK24_011570 [Pichia kluyveri]
MLLLDYHNTTLLYNSSIIIQYPQLNTSYPPPGYNIVKIEFFEPNLTIYFQSSNPNIKDNYIKFKYQSLLLSPPYTLPYLLSLTTFKLNLIPLTLTKLPLENNFKSLKNLSYPYLDDFNLHIDENTILPLNISFIPTILHSTDLHYIILNEFSGFLLIDKQSHEFTYINTSPSLSSSSSDSSPNVQLPLFNGITNINNPTPTLSITSYTDSYNSLLEFHTKNSYDTKFIPINHQNITLLGFINKNDFIISSNNTYYLNGIEELILPPSIISICQNFAISNGKIFKFNSIYDIFEPIVSSSSSSSSSSSIIHSTTKYISMAYTNNNLYILHLNNIIIEKNLQLHFQPISIKITNLSSKSIRFVIYNNINFSVYKFNLSSHSISLLHSSNWSSIYPIKDISIFKTKITILSENHLFNYDYENGNTLSTSINSKIINKLIPFDKNCLLTIESNDTTSHLSKLTYDSNLNLLHLPFLSLNGTSSIIQQWHKSIFSITTSNGIYLINHSKDNNKVKYNKLIKTINIKSIPINGIIINNFKLSNTLYLYHTSDTLYIIDITQGKIISSLSPGLIDSIDYDDELDIILLSTKSTENLTPTTIFTAYLFKYELELESESFQFKLLDKIDLMKTTTIRFNKLRKFCYPFKTPIILSYKLSKFISLDLGVELIDRPLKWSNIVFQYMKKFTIFINESNKLIIFDSYEPIINELSKLNELMNFHYIMEIDKNILLFTMDEIILIKDNWKIEKICKIPINNGIHSIIGLSDFNFDLNNQSFKNNTSFTIITSEFKQFNITI